MPQFSSYPQVTSIAASDTLLLNQLAGGVKQIDFSDFEASLSLPAISGTLPLNKGGTGSALTSPGQDAMMFWDNSATSISFLTVGTGLQIVGTVLSCTVTGGGGSGGAPTDATYITQLPNSTLTNEFALSTLATGLLKNTTITGALSIAVAGVDFFVGPGAATANAIVRFNGTTGGVAKDSNVTLADSGTSLVFSGLAGLSAGGANNGVVLTPTGTGVVFANSAIQTSPSSGGTGGKWNLGQIKTGTVSLDTTKYVEVKIDGATYKILTAP